MTRVPPPLGEVTWVGRPPPQGLVCVYAPTLSRALESTPFPDLLVVDPRDDEELASWTGPQPALRLLGAVLLVPVDHPWLSEPPVHDALLCCVPRSLPEDALRSVLAAARQLRAQKRRWSSLEHLTEGAAPALRRAVWELRTPEQAERLASVVAAACSTPERRVGGVLELLINAIEHGNLEISGPTKRVLIGEGRWYEELLARLDDPRWAHRRVRVELERNQAGDVTLVIEDEGPGFDWRAVLQQSIEQNDTRHGRGIALAKAMSFDELRWEGRGNRVVGRIRS